jgi:YidC/Oxa1 family membrane protein insertase
MKIVQPKILQMLSKFQNSNVKHDPKMVEVMAAEQQALMKRFNFRPQAQLWNLAVLPVYIGWFFGLSSLLKSPEQFFIDNLETSFLWMPSMLATDPYFLSPLIVSLISFSTLKLMISKMPVQKETPPAVQTFQKALPYLPFISIPIIATFPAGFSLYFAFLSLFNLSFVLASQTPFVYKLADIDRLVAEDEKYNQDQERLAQERSEFDLKDQTIEIQTCNKNSE